MDLFQLLVEGDEFYVALMPIIATLCNVVLLKTSSKVAYANWLFLFLSCKYSWFRYEVKWMIYVQIASFIVSFIFLFYYYRKKEQ